MPSPSTNTKPSVALIGMRGSGKSSVGAELARLLNGKHLDTDSMVAEQARLTIAEIFSSEGEQGFRARESRAIDEAARALPAVISVGGGAVLDQENLETLKRCATIVLLTAPAKILWQRIGSDRASHTTRPALTELDGLAEVEALLAKRMPIYNAAADVTVDTRGQEPVELARRIANQLHSGHDADGDRR